MCTLLIHRSPERLYVAMNRDELRTRADELPPMVQDARGVAWLGPRDQERGGTWIGANEYGLLACLLNANVSLAEMMAAMAKGGPSRGEIVPEVMGFQHIADACRHIEGGLDYEAYPPFMLVMMNLEQARRYTWNGHGHLEMQRVPNAWSMCTSSQWETEDVLERRQALFEAWERADWPQLAGMPMLNLIQMHNGKEWSPLMARDHSCTRSVTVVEVRRPARVSMLYSPLRELRLDLEEYTLEGAYSGSQ